MSLTIEQTLECYHCECIGLKIVGKQWQYSEKPDRTTFDYVDARCERCSFITRFPRKIPLRPALDFRG